MKIGILSDIHANWAALQVALAALDREGVERVFCLGDVIGYYTEPVECLEEMMDRQIPCIRGNHERYLLGEVEGEIQGTAMQAIEYTRGLLSPAHLDFVREMKNTMKVPGFFYLVHGSPRHRDEYLLAEEALERSLDKLEADFPEFRLCFFGHTHVPMVARRGEVIKGFHEDRSVALEEGHTYLVNPGSVGQPRDHCPKASFVTYDSDRRVVHFHRRDYDLKIPMSRVAEVGLDPALAERLASGH